MTLSIPLPYDTGPQDDTPTGHSFAAAWLAVIGFTVLSGLLVLLAYQAVAMNHFFGG
ncbi:hypothetical protein ACQKEK_02320 [Pseudomonas sp. NPDC077408]|uniref:hypothetical protein n=1 Tax=Streptomyces parvus TaxID=66428 RepID=UPI003712482F